MGDLLFDDFDSNEIDTEVWEPSCNQEGCRIELKNSCLELILPGAAPKPRPQGASNIRSKQSFDSGLFRVRMKAQACEPEAELVNSFYTYFHDDSPDANNSEIDIEILGSEPHIIYLTVWTHADSQSGKQKRVTRIVDLRAGTWKQSALDPDGFFVRDDPFAPPPFPITGDYDFSFSKFDASKDFFDYSFSWEKEEIVYTMAIEGKEYELWVLDAPGTIPQKSARICSNIWWPTVHWNDKGDSRAPAKESVHRLDSIRVEEI